MIEPWRDVIRFRERRIALSLSPFVFTSSLSSALHFDLLIVFCPGPPSSSRPCILQPMMRPDVPKYAKIWTVNKKIGEPAQNRKPAVGSIHPLLGLVCKCCRYWRTCLLRWTQDTTSRHTYAVGAVNNFFC